jgi:hypothetical protein
MCAVGFGFIELILGIGGFQFALGSGFWQVLLIVLGLRLH